MEFFFGFKIGYHSNFIPECNTERGFKNQLYIELGLYCVQCTLVFFDSFWFWTCPCTNMGLPTMQYLLFFDILWNLGLLIWPWNLHNLICIMYCVFPRDLIAQKCLQKRETLALNIKLFACYYLPANLSIIFSHSHYVASFSIHSLVKSCSRDLAKVWIL